jgi:phosphoesterase RecJ-like protein
MRDFDRIVDALRAAPSVAVFSHVYPEGDAIGASLGACLALEAAGKAAGAYNAGPLPVGLRHLPAIEKLRERVERAYACYLVVDTTDPARTGGLLDARAPGAVVLNVDHHPGNSGFGDLNWVETAASSAGEMVYQLLRAGGFPVPAPAADNLYAAILTDTGSFRHANTSPAALHAAAELVAAGAAPADVARCLFGQRSPREYRLLQLALDTLGVSADGRVAWISVSRAAQEAAGVGLEAAEDFVQYPRALAGVEVALTFKEAAAGEVKVSLRSRGALDVAAVARRFGGGGHRNAAGCTLRGDLEAARAAILAGATALVEA